MGAEPKPDSLLNKPRAIPKRIANITVAPAKPPPAAEGVNALLTISLNAAPMKEALITKITIQPNMYNPAINGTNFSHHFCNRLYTT